MSTDTVSLKGKTIVVTGATSGLGRAICHMALEQGSRVVGVGRREERLAELAGAGVGEFVGLSADLRQEPDILRVFEAVRERFGGTDILVNNAGLGFKSSLLEGETEAWRETLEVNVLALSVCTREATRDMRRRGDTGHVVNISSMAGHRVPGSGMYSASKFAVRALTEGLRQELRALRSKIRVSAISPGLVETEFMRHYHDSEAKAREIYSAIEVMQPEDIAQAVYYVLTQPPRVQVHDILVRPTQQEN